MRNKVIPLAFLGAAILAGLVVARGCGGKNQGEVAAQNGADKAATAAPAPRPGPAAPAASGAIVITVDAGPGGDAAGGPEVVFSATWGGSRMDQLGRARPQEGNPEAPMAVTVDGKGRMFVLDQVNGRVVRVGADGKPEGIIPLKQQESAQDLAVADDGSAAVLDRFSSKSVVLYDEKGNVRGEIPLEGEGIEETGLVSGIFTDGKDVYVEKEHGPLVRIGTTDGQPSPDRGEIPGRPTRDGLSFINAGIIDANAGRMYVNSIERATMQHRFTRELRQTGEIRGIHLLDTDKTGTIYLATQVERPNEGEVLVLTCLEPLKGVPVGSAALPVNTMPEETFRDLAVLDEGGVIYSLRTEAGVSYQKYDCQ
ncbi:hypothetical protein [Polyangium aurulentum]|uniref:hypothetical protein n=1 Tax=Polyangium aurulentum TaxID=2567896 RepID=UPI0010AEAC41|nr:hypothetical protein [Polyangium aurulentum]UQA56353.1 hypothetical protein E8A73_034305 [Polyangium aurulentum]